MVIVPGTKRQYKNTKPVNIGGITYTAEICAKRYAYSLLKKFYQILPKLGRFYLKNVKKNEPEFLMTES